MIIQQRKSTCSTRNLGLSSHSNDWSFSSVFQSNLRKSSRAGIEPTPSWTLAHNQQCCQISNSQPFWKSLQPPKRPPGAFLKFMNQRSQEITAKFPDASHVERCKIAGQLWRNLDSDEKNEFQRLGRPKKPPNCFSLYIKETRAQQGRADPPGFLQGLVQSWKLMSENEKEIYRTKANREKGKYEQEMTRWEQKMKHMGREDLIRKKSVNKPASSTKTTGKKTGR
ncbi:transcription factor A, mitochondrial-like isoform X3 [Babylonia areolata]|uniref:transcription factor A, mitochondrial-like isoform X3 n=1 Tax=Babylonia areolata TaxID=304850 RepID=UPI003FD4A17C